MAFLLFRRVGEKFRSSVGGDNEDGNNKEKRA